MDSLRSFVAALCCLALPGCGGAGTAAVGVPSENNPPVFGSPPDVVPHNQAFAYEVSVSDPDGDSIELTVEEMPAWVDWNSESGEFSGLPDWENIGQSRFRIRAHDGTSAAVQQFNLTVSRGEIICLQEFGDPTTSLYTLPYRTGSTYKIIQSYCPTNPAWGHHDWFAYDFDTRMGDTILTSRSGVVLFTQSDQEDGTRLCRQNAENFVFVQHEDGTVMQYVHFMKDGVLVQPGQQVSAGEPIGLSGDSGCSSGPHLHVALFRDRTNFDRQSTLPFNYSNAVGALDARNGLLMSVDYTASPEGG